MTMGILYPVRGISATSAEFRRRLREVAAAVTVDPTDLAAIIAFESNFDPRARNVTSKATGLIQWIPSTAAALYRLTVDQIAAMSDIEQLGLVQRYFASAKGRGYDLHTLYMLVWNGSPAAQDKVLGIADAPGHSGAVYVQNRGLDLNRDGRITAGEASSIVRSIAAAARKLPPIDDGDDTPKAPAPTEGVGSSSGPLSSDGRCYRVKPGDTPWRLAERLAGKGARWRELYQDNARATIDQLVAGRRIILPEGWRRV